MPPSSSSDSDDGVVANLQLRNDAATPVARYPAVSVDAAASSSDLGAVPWPPGSPHGDNWMFDGVNWVECHPGQRTGPTAFPRPPPISVGNMEYIHGQVNSFEHRWDSTLKKWFAPWYQPGLRATCMAFPLNSEVLYRNVEQQDWLPTPGQAPPPVRPEDGGQSSLWNAFLGTGVSGPAFNSASVPLQGWLQLSTLSLATCLAYGADGSLSEPYACTQNQSKVTFPCTYLATKCTNVNARYR